MAEARSVRLVGAGCEVSIRSCRDSFTPGSTTSVSGPGTASTPAATSTVRKYLSPAALRFRRIHPPVFSRAMTLRPRIRLCRVILAAATGRCVSITYGKLLVP